MRWINAEAIIEVTLYDEEHEEYRPKRMTVEDFLESYTYGCPPTIEIESESIRHGHWIMLHKTYNVDEDNDYDWKCSECNHVDCHNINVEVPYCWSCGARMDEEGNEDESY